MRNVRLFALAHLVLIAIAVMGARFQNAAGRTRQWNRVLPVVFDAIGRQRDAVVRKVDLARLPLYVRAGAVLPTGPLGQFTNEVAVEPVTITTFPGANGASSLYEDDGESFDFRNGEFTRIEMQWEDAARQLRIHLASGVRMLSAKPRTFSIKVIDSNETKTVVFNGDPMSVAL